MTTPTPRPSADDTPLDTDPAVMRRTWRYIRQLRLASAMTEDDAYEYARCASGLERAGWTLTATETDWQPPTEGAHDGTDH